MTVDLGTGDRNPAALEVALWRCRLDLEAAREDADHLHAALDSSRRIGIAVGVVMERYELPADRAVGILRQLSMDPNRTFADIALEIAGTGALPETARWSWRVRPGGR